MPDGRSFLYNRLQKLAEGAPPTDLYQKSRVYLHVLSANPDTDRVVFGYEVDPSIKLGPTPLPFAFVPINSKYVFAVVNSGVSPNSEYYVTTIDKMGQTPIPWRRIASLDDDIAGLDIHGDDLYLNTYRSTPRFKVVHINLAQPDLAKSDTVFPASEAVVISIATAEDADFVRAIDSSVSTPSLHTHKRGCPTRIP